MGGPPPRPRDRRRPGGERALRAHARRARRDAPLRPADRVARLRLARAAGARARGARARLQDARRRDRAAQPRAAATSRSPSRCPTTRRRRELPHLRVRRRRLRRAWRGSPSSRTTWPTRSSATRAAARRARAGSSSSAQTGSCPRSPRASPSSPPGSCAGAGSRCAPARGSTAWTSARATLSTGERVPARTVCWTAGVKPPPIVAELGPPAHGGRPDRRPTRACGCPGSDNVWAIGDAAAVPDPAQSAAGRRARRPPSTRSARARGRGRQRRRRARRQASRARSATARSASSSTWASTRRWPRCSASGCAASRPGSPRAPTTWRMMPGMARRLAPGGRLDGRAPLRARVRRARPARPSALPGRPPRRGATAGRGARPVTELASARVAPATCRPSSSSARRAATRRGEARGLLRRSSRTDGRRSTPDWERERPLLEFLAAQADGVLLDLRGRRARSSATRAWRASARWTS